MFTAFMSDAANIMAFYGTVDVDDSVGYATELWIFKPQKSGKQVIGLLEPKLLYIFYIIFIILPTMASFSPRSYILIVHLLRYFYLFLSLDIIQTIHFWSITLFLL